MQSKPQQQKSVVILDTKYWDNLQKDVRDAIRELNKITGKINAHTHVGAWEAEHLLDYTDRKVREIRKILEDIVSPI